MRRFSPLAQRRIRAFAANRRALTALVVFVAVFVLTLFAELIANDRPLLLKYNGKLYFPVLAEYTEQEFGGDFPTPADYRDEFVRQNIEKSGWMIMPPVPFSEGRDILARILYGIRLSVVFAFLLTMVSSLIGISAGAVQGYFGGRVDIFMQRFMEIWESLPQLFILIIVASIFVPTFWSLLIILMFFSWTSLTGMVRAEFLRARNLEYVKAAKALGVGNGRIIFRHILPNAVVTTVTFVPFILSEAIVALTALDFLGLGLSQDYPSLGDLVRQGKDNLQAPWIGITIFIVLSSLLTLLIFIGEGVRDAFDARKSK